MEKSQRIWNIIFVSFSNLACDLLYSLMLETHANKDSFPSIIKILNS